MVLHLWGWSRDPQNAFFSPFFERESFMKLMKTLVYDGNVEAGRLVGEPIMHHYSWVRTETQMLQKVKSWGHAEERSNWTEIVQNEFSVLKKDYNNYNPSVEFVHNRPVEKVEEPFVRCNEDNGLFQCKTNN